MQITLRRPAVYQYCFLFILFLAGLLVIHTSYSENPLHPRQRDMELDLNELKRELQNGDFWKDLTGQEET